MNSVIRGGASISNEGSRGQINCEKSMNAILNTNFPNLTVFVERYKPFSDLISGAAEEDISNFIHNCQDMEMEGRCP